MAMGALVHSVYEAGYARLTKRFRRRSYCDHVDFVMAYCGADVPEDRYRNDVETCFRALQIAFYPHEVTLKKARFDVHFDAHEFWDEFLTGSVVTGEYFDTWYFERAEDAFHFRMRF